MGWGWVGVQLLLGTGCVPLGFVTLSRPPGLFHCKHEGGSHLVVSWVPQVTQCCHNGQGS